MAKVRIEEIIEDLDSEMKRALEDAVKEILPEAEFDRNTLYRAFLRAVRRKCSNWETVKDQNVEKS
jgi:hypothetical protein